MRNSARKFNLTEQAAGDERGHNYFCLDCYRILIPGKRIKFQLFYKKYIWVDTYARWRISDPLVFYQRVRDERGAQSRLDDVIDGETRNVIANYDLIEVVRSSNREFERTEETAILQAETEVAKIQVGREKLAQMILANASKITPQFGVEVRDMRIKRINYVDEVQQKVFDRMIAERKRIASKYRSEGDGRSAEI